MSLQSEIDQDVIKNGNVHKGPKARLPPFILLLRVHLKARPSTLAPPHLKQFQRLPIHVFPPYKGEQLLCLRAFVIIMFHECHQESWDLN